VIILPKKPITSTPKTATIKVTPTENIKQQAKDMGMTVQDYTEKVLFGDGFSLYVQESQAKGEVGLKFISSYNNTVFNQPIDVMELRRLRDKCAPVSRGIEFLKDTILGSGIGIKIKDPLDKDQIAYKETLENLIENIRQDRYTKGFDTIVDLMYDEGLTTGQCAAEIVYDREIDFNEYATEGVTVTDDNAQQSTGYEVEEPKWKDSELVELTKLKIIDNSINRLKAYRDKSWEIAYWTLDEIVPETPETAADVAAGRTKNQSDKRPKPLNEVIKLHPWQLFYLSPNRRSWHEKSKSVIEPVARLAQILEKMEQATGEGLFRAGNKKYFIITGDPKRQWGDNTILNIMKKINEIGADPNKAAIPVPAGFDIKEMGGQVFEGTQIFDHFISMIADGMNVPKEVLTGETRAGPNYSWQSSLTNCRRRQKRLERDIITQLFEIAIWLKYGKEKTKPSGRSTKTIPIPKIKWFYENQLSRQEHLDIIHKMLNTSNPVYPNTKQALEADFCDMMNYDTVLLPTQEEVKKEDKEQKEVKKKLQDATLKKAENPEPKMDPLTKTQGQPEAPTEDKLEKRKEKGSNTALKPSGGDSQKGIAKPQGGTRQPQP